MRNPTENKMICEDNKIRDIVKVDRALACSFQGGELHWFGDGIGYVELKKVVDLRKNGN